MKKMTQEDVVHDFCAYILIFQLTLLKDFLILSVMELSQFTCREALHCQRSFLLFQNCGKWMAGLVPSLPAKSEL